MRKRIRRGLTEAFSILFIVGLVILAPILALALLAGAGVTLAALTAPHAWSERDWDGDGTTTLGEFYYATDVGRLSVFVNGQRCDKLIDFKDGRTIKTVCPDAAS